MYGHTKSMSKVFFKYNNFTSFRIWEWFQIGCMPSRQFLGMQHTNLHQSLKTEWGAHRHTPLLIHEILSNFGLHLLLRGHSPILLDLPFTGCKKQRHSYQWLGFGGGESRGGGA
jgi:hypothetical protein